MPTLSRRRCSSLCSQISGVQESSSWNAGQSRRQSGLGWVEGEFGGLGCDGMDQRWLPALCLRLETKSHFEC